MNKHRCLFLIASLLLTVMLCFAPLRAPLVLLAEETFAAQEVSVLHEGTCGERLTWALRDDGTFTVSGTGAMHHYTGPGSGDAPWMKYQDRIRTIIIEEGVTGIGNYSFYQCTSLQSVSLPKSLTAIGSWAFYNCPQLTEVVWPDGLQSIGEHAFGRSKLTALHLPDSVTKIGTRAFESCTSLQTAALPNALEELAAGLFYGCTALEEVHLPVSVHHIGVSAFSGCKALRNVYYTGTTTQWYAIQVSSENDYLKNADITFHYTPPSDITDVSDITPVFYTTTPFTALRRGETMDLLVRLYKNGELLSPSDGLMLNTLSPGIIANSTSPDGWQFTFKAAHNTYNDVQFQIPGTNFAATTSFYTFNGTHAFRCGCEWSPPVPASTLALADYTCTVSSFKEHTITMDVCNTAYSYGAAIAWDANGILLDVQPIPAKINDGRDVVVDGQRLMQLAGTGTDWFTADGMACRTNLSMTLPEEAELSITADSFNTSYPALFTAIDLFTRVLLAQSDATVSDAERQPMVLAMIDELLYTLSPTDAQQLGASLHLLLINHNPIPGLCVRLYDQYGKDISGYTALLQKAGIGASLPARLDFSPGTISALLTRSPEIAWPVLDYVYNQGRGASEIRIAPHDQRNTLTDNTLIVQSAFSFDDSTVLQAQYPVSIAHTPHPLSDGLSDCVLYHFSLLKNGKSYEPATAFELPHRTLTVSLPLTAELTGRPCAVYRLNDDGTRTFVHADFRDGYAVFETDCTGSYIIGVLPKESPLPAFLAALIVLMLCIPMFYRQKHTTTKDEDK